MRSWGTGKKYGVSHQVEFEKYRDYCASNISTTLFVDRSYYSKAGVAQNSSASGI